MSYQSNQCVLFHRHQYDNSHTIRDNYRARCCCVPGSHILRSGGHWQPLGVRRACRYSTHSKHQTRTFQDYRCTYTFACTQALSSFLSLSLSLGREGEGGWVGEGEAQTQTYTHSHMNACCRGSDCGAWVRAVTDPSVQGLLRLSPLPYDGILPGNQHKTIRS